MGGEAGAAAVGVPLKGKPRAAPVQSAQPAGDWNHRDHHHHDRGGQPTLWLPLVPSYPFIWGGGYTPAFSPYPFSMLPGPVVMPPARRPAVVGPQPAPADDDAEPAIKKTLKVSNPELKAKAGKYIGYGDANFAKQKYLPAVAALSHGGRFCRTDLAEIYLRKVVH